MTHLGLCAARLCGLIVFALLLSACASPPGKQAYRFQGDEIMVAGQLFHTGAPVVLWMHPGGYDAYRVERRFSAFDESGWHASRDTLDTPNRYGLRHRGGGWDLPLLQQTVDQFVIHYDASGTSARCFNTLHDNRGLSAHFLLDVDGTIYQTLDLKERAWHAGVANDRSIGIEIANVGAYPPGDPSPLDRWYRTDPTGSTLLTPPDPAGIRTPSFIGRPARPQRVHGQINGRPLMQHDLTPQQYESLIRLTAALCRIFPRLNCDAPRDEQGNIRMDRPLTPQELAAFRGLLGHHHVSADKVDPGPAFQWERVIRDVRARLSP